MRKEMRVRTGPRNIRHRTVRKPQVGARRRHWHGPANQAGLADLVARETTDITESSSPEIRSTDPGNAIGHTRISICIVNICVRNVKAPVEPPIITPAPPRVKHLIGRQRHPTDVAESEAHTPAAESEEPHQRRGPVVPHAHHSRIPTPPETRAPEPAAVMVGRPTPGVIANPSPTIPILPDPAAVLIRSPPRVHRGPPDSAIVRVAAPRAVRVHVLGAIYARSHIAGAHRADQDTVAALIPAVPIVGSRRRHNLELGIGTRAPNQHGLAGIDPL